MVARIQERVPPAWPSLTPAFNTEYDMAIPRELEPEFVDTAEESQNYRDMDHDAVNSRFVTDLLAGGEVGTRVVDNGAHQPIRAVGVPSGRTA